MQEIELSSKECCEVALYMWEQYKKAMRPPLLTFVEFEDWLNMILKNLENVDDSK